MKSLRPVIPEDRKRKEFLQVELKKMGLDKLMELPWSMQSDKMLQELAGYPVKKEFRNSKRGKPDRWTEQDIASAFQVPAKGIPMLPRGGPAADSLLCRED